MSNESKDSLSLPRQFLEELKRRRVIRVATLYVLALWPIIQIVDILAPALGLPAIAMRYLLIVFVAGLPIALILSWLYDLNKGGIVRTTEGERPGHPLIGRSAEITVISALIMAVAVLFLLQSTLDFDESEPAISTAPRNSGISSIAVLPFVTFSQNPDDELFSDGLTEELLNVLSQIRYLRVIARTTSFSYKGVSRNVQDIGRELGVDTILEGSVRRNDVENTIRVTAQLIDTDTGTHLWSSSFDREFRDIFKIQDEKLDLTLADDEARRIQSRATATPEAMIAFGMGREAVTRRTTQALSDAQRYFLRAVELDPAYVDAYAELANVYSLKAGQQAQERDALLEAAQVLVDRAMDLDELSGAAWAAQGLIHMVRGETDPDALDHARDALARAIELNPSLPMANMWYGNLMEDPKDRQRYHSLAFELDPRSPVAGFNLANDLMLAGREAESMEIFSRIVEADPNYPGAYTLIAQLSELRGRLGEAIHNYERVYQLQPDGATAAKLADLWIDIGDFDRAQEWLGRAESEGRPDLVNQLTWLEISIAVAQGDTDAAAALMAPLAQTTADDPIALINRVRAAYFLQDYESAVAAWEALDADKTAAHAMELELLEVQVAAAFAYRQIGREKVVNKLLDAAQTSVQEKVDSSHMVNPGIWFLLAQIHAIKGESNLALIHLQRAVDEGWRQHWRPEVEPCLASLTHEP
ncbi:MAG: hypothetical protein P8Y69_18425, partial [Gammaproteobacteria bacterium]